MTLGLARRSHYVPEDYLSAWSDDKTHVNANRLLVPTARYRLLEPRSISGLFYFTDLYTTIERDGEPDQLERWLNTEIETPTADALDKARTDRPLTKSDWARLAMYTAALDVRTPTRYVDHVAFLDRNMPDILGDVLARAKQEIERATAEGRPLEPITPQDPPHVPLPRMPVRASVEKNPNGDGGFLRVEFVAGRASWVQSIYSNLTGPAKHLTRHQ
jgi:hypothetical protein